MIYNGGPLQTSKISTLKKIESKTKNLKKVNEEGRKFNKSL